MRSPGRLARGGLKAQPSPEPACPDPAPQTQEKLLEQSHHVESIFTVTCYHTHIPPHTHTTQYIQHTYITYTHICGISACVYSPQTTHPSPIHTPPHINTHHTHNTYVHHTPNTHTSHAHSPYASQIPTHHRRTHTGDCFISPQEDMPWRFPAFPPRAGRGEIPAELFSATRWR